MAMTPGNELHDAFLTIKMRTSMYAAGDCPLIHFGQQNDLFRAQKWLLAEWLNTLPKRAQRT